MAGRSCDESARRSAWQERERGTGRTGEVEAGRGRKVRGACGICLVQLVYSSCFLCDV